MDRKKQMQHGECPVSEVLIANVLNIMFMCTKIVYSILVPAGCNLILQSQFCNHINLQELLYPVQGYGRYEAYSRNTGCKVGESPWMGQFISGHHAHIHTVHTCIHTKGQIRVSKFWSVEGNWGSWRKPMERNTLGKHGKNFWTVAQAQE